MNIAKWLKNKDKKIFDEWLEAPIDIKDWKGKSYNLSIDLMNWLKEYHLPIYDEWVASKC